MIVAPGIFYGFEFRALSLSLGAWQGTLAINMVIGAILIVAALTAKYAKPISSIPEDFRLGLAAGIGGFLCLVGLWNSSIVPRSGGIVSSWDYRVLLAMIGLMIIVILENQEKTLASRYSYVIEIILITVISICIRYGSDTLYISEMGKEGSVGEIAGQVSASSWDTNQYLVLKYVIWNTLNKYIDIIGSVTSIILCACMTKLGYSKEIFQDTLKESKKLTFVYLADGLANLFISPLLGTGLVTPFIESVAGVVVGARTGLASVVCGSLFLISAPFAVQLGQIIPGEATGPALIISCFAIIKCVKYIDERKAVKLVPSYFVFVMIPFTQSIGAGFSFAYLILFATWLTSDMWTSITPQMIFGFACTILLALLATNVMTTFDQLVIVTACLVLIGLLGAILSFKFSKSVQARFGKHQSTEEMPPSSQKLRKSTEKAGAAAIQHSSAPSAGTQGNDNLASARLQTQFRSENAAGIQGMRTGSGDRHLQHNNNEPARSSHFVTQNVRITSVMDSAQPESHPDHTHQEDKRVSTVSLA